MASLAVDSVSFMEVGQCLRKAAIWWQAWGGIEGQQGAKVVAKLGDDVGLVYSGILDYVLKKEVKDSARINSILQGAFW